MESSLVNGKIPISYLYLKQFILSHTAICTYAPEFQQHAVLVWFCLNNSSTLWCDLIHLQPGATPFSRNTWTNGLTVRMSKKNTVHTEPFQARSKSSIGAISSTVSFWESSASRTSGKDVPLLLSCPTENDNVQPGTILHQNTHQRAM